MQALVPSPYAPDATLEPEYGQFAALRQQIDGLKQALHNLQEWADTCTLQYRKKAAPLWTQRHQVQAQLIALLDGRLQQKGLSVKLREDIVHILCNMAQSLTDGPSRPDIVAILQRYATHKAVHNHTEAIASTPLPASEFEALFEATMRKMQDAHHQRETAKALHKQAARLKPVAKSALDNGRTLRETYRKLVSALHPDRATDEAQRLHKTALMQLVTTAYNSQDLGALLALQVQAGALYASAADARSKLRPLNQALAQQAASLQTQLTALQAQVRAQFGMGHGSPLTAATLQTAVRASLQSLAMHIQTLQRDVLCVQDDPNLKRWVKAQQDLTA